MLGLPASAMPDETLMMLPAPLLDHQRDYLLAEEKRRCHVADEAVIPVFERDILQHAPRVVDDGIVDHHIDSPIALDGELDQGDDVLFDHDITPLVGDFTA